MKIGILTHHYVSNYGAFLQVYALAEAVSREFPDDVVEIIDYINVKHFIINFGGWFRFYPERENIRCWLEKTKVPLTFAAARKKDLRLSPRCYTAAQVNRQGYDIIIVGSDEVWNYRDRKSQNSIKFGHKLACRNLIAYAPSVGNSEGEIPEYVRNGIQRFKIVSVRDDLTGRLVQQITGEKTVRVADPTILSGFPSGEVQNLKKPYILFYYCDHLPESVKKRILDYAYEHDMAVYGAGECNKKYDSITVNLHPFAWVDMFRNAEYVFTGTFHGTVFSILNRRQFWVYLTNKSRIQKVRDLLNDCGIENREIKEDFSFHSSEKIDYSMVDKRLEECRRKSVDFLHNAIDAVRKLQES